MRGPGRADIVNAGSRESGYSECRSGESGHNGHSGRGGASTIGGYKYMLGGMGGMQVSSCDG
ncbi:unnamed protein product, partial [Staurois parvus]